MLDYIEDKVARLTGLPRSYGEAFNILRYKLGQHYDSHYDFCAYAHVGCVLLHVDAPSTVEETQYGPQASNRVRHTRTTP